MKLTLHTPPAVGKDQRINSGVAEQLITLTRVVFLLEQRIAKLERACVDKVPPIKRGMPKTQSVLIPRAILKALLEESAAMFAVSVADIISKIRLRPANQARQWVMIEAHLQGVSYGAIGAALGRHWQTIEHGVEVEEHRRDMAARARGE